MKNLLLCGGLAVLTAAPAAAQSAEIGISGGFGVLGDKQLSVSEVLGELNPITRDEFSLDNGIRIGARLAFNPRNRIGHEISYAFQNAGLKQVISGTDPQNRDLGGVKAHNMYYNLVAHATGTGSPVRPFVTGGGGFTSFFLPGQSSFSGTGDTKFGYNYGAGVKFNFFLYGFRLDVRNHVTGKPFGRFLPNVNGTLHNLEISATFSFLLG